MTNPNNRTRMIWAGIATLLLSAMAPSIAVAEPDPGSSEVDPCTYALQDARSQLAALADVAPVTPLEGSALVDQVAGEACGFSILGNQLPADKEQLAASIREVTGEDASAHQRAYSNVDLGSVSDGAGGGSSSKLVSCTKSGDGTGSIVGTLLGVVLKTEAAAGNWDGADKIVDVTGTGAIMSGTEAAGAGSMFLGPVGPIPSLGPAGAICMETTTTTVIHGHCWWLIIYTSCTAEVKTTVSVTLCGADAFQDAAGLGLLTYDHLYVVEGNPCNLNVAALELDVSPYTDAAADEINSVLQSVSVNTVKTGSFDLGVLDSVADFFSF